jgi:hypothetical protein
VVTNGTLVVTDGTLVIEGEVPEKEKSPMFLMQRLNAPRAHNMTDGVKLHHVFGGGLLGLSEDGWKVLDEVCTLAYMGSAEYEFGVLPKFLTSWVAGHANLRPFAFVLKPGDYKTAWGRDTRSSRKSAAPPMPPLRSKVIYGLVRVSAGTGKKEVQALETAFRAVASGELYVKAGARIDAALDPERDRKPPYALRDDGPQGWIALGHDAMFFCAESMFEGFASLFELDLTDFEAPEVPALPDYATWAKPDLVHAAVASGICHTVTAARKQKKAALVEQLLAPVA